MTSFAMTRIDLRGRTLSTAELRTALPRGGVDVDAIVPKVRPIVDDIAERGAPAALEYGEKFDGVRPETVRVPAAALAAALAAMRSTSKGHARPKMLARKKRALARATSRGSPSCAK